MVGSAAWTEVAAGMSAASSGAAAVPNRVDIPAEGFETVPAAQKTAPAASKSTKAAPHRVLHTVKRGETLYSIAQRYGLTVDSIRKENRLRKHQALVAGSRLSLTLAVIR